MPRAASSPETHEISSILSREEIKHLTAPSDIQGWRAVFTTWGLIALAFLVLGRCPNPLTWAVALVLLGGQHLALAILMHEASHRSLFRTRWLNDWVGTWLCAEPTWNHLQPYRAHHMAHHRYARGERDPDSGLSDPFPIQRASLIRKLLRDILGVTAIKRIYGLLAMDLGFIEYTASTGVKPIDQTGRGWSAVLRMGAANLWRVVLTNALLAIVLSLLGHGWLYAAWVVAYCTTFSVILRVRSIVEHAMTTYTQDNFLNTRTTQANVLAQLTVAPHQVNYHLEHHLLMTAPYFRLRQIHVLLRERGALEGTHQARGYLEVLRLVTDPNAPKGQSRPA